MEHLRAGMDGVGGSPPPFSKADRLRFLQTLDRALVRMGRKTHSILLTSQNIAASPISL